MNTTGHMRLLVLVQVAAIGTYARRQAWPQQSPKRHFVQAFQEMNISRVSAMRREL